MHELPILEIKEAISTSHNIKDYYIINHSLPVSSTTSSGWAPWETQTHQEEIDNLNSLKSIKAIGFVVKSLPTKKIHAQMILLGNVIKYLKNN